MRGFTFWIKYSLHHQETSLISTDSHKCGNQLARYPMGTRLKVRHASLYPTNWRTKWSVHLTVIYRAIVRTSNASNIGWRRNLFYRSERMRLRRVRVDSWIANGVKRKKCDEGDYKSSVGHVEKVNRPGKM